MRVLLDANVPLDCLILEANGQPRPGQAASAQLFEQCDLGIHAGLVAWHTLTILGYYFGRQNSTADTAAMLDGLLAVLEVPTVGHREAAGWHAAGVADFEDALQVMSALAGSAGVIVTRNITDFAGAPSRR